MIEVYEDVVPKYYQDYIENLITGIYSYKNKKFIFPLYFVDKISTGFSENKNEYGFSSIIYNGNNVGPHGISLVQPLLNIIENKNLILSDLIRARVYLLTPTLKSEILKPHTDQLDPHLVALYYVNDTDGDTIFYDNNKSIIKKVSPKKGQIVVFDGGILHSGSTPSLNKRITINYNFNVMDPMDPKNY